MRSGKGLSSVFADERPSFSIKTSEVSDARLGWELALRLYFVADGELEAVSASLELPFWQTLRRVTIPVALPAILNLLLFVTAMTTVSALISFY